MKKNRIAAVIIALILTTTTAVAATRDTPPRSTPREVPRVIKIIKRAIIALGDVPVPPRPDCTSNCG